SPDDMWQAQLGNGLHDARRIVEERALRASTTLPR
ncbi:MAG: hypothetical protein ACI8Q9_002605, partial [Planctomycetota bacterium]